MARENNAKLQVVLLQVSLLISLHVAVSAFSRRDKVTPIAIKKILKEYSLLDLQTSPVSELAFEKFREAKCLTHLNETDKVRYFLIWEKNEFVKSITKLLDTNDGKETLTNSELFVADGETLYSQEIASNCTIKNMTMIEKKTDGLSANDDFEDTTMHVFLTGGFALVVVP